MKRNRINSKNKSKIWTKFVNDLLKLYLFVKKKQSRGKVKRKIFIFKGIIPYRI